MSLYEELLLTVSSALDEYITLPGLGGELIVFEGQFSLRKGKMKSNVYGKVFYSFCEKVELLFEGKALDPFPLSWFEESVDLVTENSLSGSALVLGSQGDRINGLISRLETERYASCDRFRWCYLNGPWVFGDDVRRGSRGLSKDRSVFQDDKFRIVFENRAGYRKQKRHRELSHICELTSIEGDPITIDEAIDEILLFSRFVSFFAGCQHAPFFIEGLDGGTVQYAFHSVGHDRSLVGVSSWKPDFKDRDLIGLWPKFRAKRHESLDQYDVLNTVIHWYLAANMNDGMLEGAYVLGFAGIQLLSAEIAGTGLKNKEIIDDFFSRLKLDVHMDAEDISRMRNWLAHYEGKNRIAYQGLSFEEKYARLEVVLQVLELAILYWLGYEGHFSNRRGSKWQGGDVELVPWLPAVNE